MTKFCLKEAADPSERCDQRWDFEEWKGKITFVSFISNNVMIAHYDGEVQKENHDIKRNNFVLSFLVALFYTSDFLESNTFVDVKLRNITFPFQATFLTSFVPYLCKTVTKTMSYFQVNYDLKTFGNPNILYPTVESSKSEISGTFIIINIFIFL